MIQRFVVKVEEGKLRAIRQSALQKLLDLACRPTAQIQDAARTGMPRRAGCFLDKAFAQAGDAVPMRLRWPLLEQPKVDHLRKESTSFQRIARNHIDHFIISSVSQRLGI